MGLSVSRLLSGLFGKKEMRMYMDAIALKDSYDEQVS